MRFKSKISYSLAALFVALFIAIIAIYVMMDVRWALKIMIFLPILPSIALVVDIYLHTYYTIEGATLYIKGGVLVNLKIPIRNITAISRSGSWLSSPALSTERIKIIYNKRSSVLISPESTEEFVNMLLTVNPAIAVNI